LTSIPFLFNKKTEKAKKKGGDGDGDIQIKRLK
jgi:hypothetical protein